jgi:hypothetical protein
MPAPIRVKVPQRAQAALTWLAEIPPDQFDGLSEILGEPTISPETLSTRVDAALPDVPADCVQELLTELFRLLALRTARNWRIDQIAEHVSRDGSLALSDGQRATLQDRLTEAMSKRGVAKMARRQQGQKRFTLGDMFRIGTKAGKITAGGIALAAGVVAILAYLGWNPFTSTPAKPPAPASVLSRVLSEVDKVKVPAAVAQLASSATSTCARATVNFPPESAAKCWLFASQFDVGSPDYQSAIAAIDRAQGLDTRVADPYDALGVLYYQLIIFYLVHAGRYHIVSPSLLIVDVQPDADSKALATLAEQQFQQAQGLPFIAANVQPVNMQVTSQQQIAQAQDQISAISNGQTELQLNPDDILTFIVDVKYTTTNPAVTHETSAMVTPLFSYMKAHPDDFQGLPPNFPSP